MTMTEQRASYTVHYVKVLQTFGFLAPHLAYNSIIEELDEWLEFLEREGQPYSLTMDGEVCGIDTYLSYRPENIERIEALVQNGQLSIGPWYRRPHGTILPQPESLIRNLLLGMNTARAFGEPLKVADLRDGMGEFAQMPQIIRGFGMESALIQVGLGEEPFDLHWEGLDGSRVWLAYLKEGYATYGYGTLNHTQFNALFKDDSTNEIPTSESGFFLYISNRGTPKQEVVVTSENTPHQLLHSTFTDYVERLKDRRDLPIVRGELRSPQHANTQPGLLTARLWSQRLMHTTETILIRHFEPISALVETALTSAHNKYRPQSALQMTWRSVVNHQATPEQTTPMPEPMLEAGLIEGVSVSNDLADHALYRLRGLINLPVKGNLVFNPSQIIRTEFIQNGDGAFAEWIYAPDIPPMGYAIVERQYEDLDFRDTPATDLTIENEFIRAQVDPAGPTVTLYDKVRNVEYSRLLIFRDEGDQGGFVQFTPVGRGIQNSRDLHIEGLSGELTQFYEDLSYSVVMTIDPAPEMNLPPMPAPGLFKLIAHVKLRLTKGVPRLDATITITNTFPNHRLRAHFPLPFQAKTAYYDGSFEVSERPIEDLPPISPPDGWAGSPLAAQPVKAFVAVFNPDPDAPGHGLIIANRGLPEAEVLTNEDEQSEIAITVLRSYNLIGDNFSAPFPNLTMTPKIIFLTDMIGDFTVELSIIPASFGDLSVGFDQAWAYADGQMMQTRYYYRDNEPAGTLPERLSLMLSSDARFRITAVKLPFDQERSGLIVRGFNYSQTEFEITLTPYRSFAVCDVTRMDETETGGKLAVEATGAVSFFAAPHRVLTFWFHD